MKLSTGVISETLTLPFSGYFGVEKKLKLFTEIPSMFDILRLLLRALGL
jgi:hypothetical protein